MSLVANVIASSAGKAAAETTDSLTRDLREMCQASGWPMKLVMNLRVQLDSGKYSIFVPKAIQDEVYALEYGNGTQSDGSHILFTFLNNLHTTDLDDQMFQQFMKVGLV